jgi:hypothetical protein
MSTAFGKPHCSPRAAFEIDRFGDVPGSRGRLVSVARGTTTCISIHFSDQNINAKCHKKVADAQKTADAEACAAVKWRTLRH